MAAETNKNGNRTPPLLNVGPPSLNAVALSNAITPLRNKKKLTRKKPNVVNAEEKEQGQAFITPPKAAAVGVYTEGSESAKRQRSFARTKNVIFEYTERNGRPVRVETNKKTGEEIRVMYLNGGGDNGNGDELNITHELDEKNLENINRSNNSNSVATGFAIPDSKPYAHNNNVQMVTENEVKSGQYKIATGQPIPSKATSVLPKGGRRRSHKRKKRSRRRSHRRRY